jgi:hypothetical protein
LVIKENVAQFPCVCIISRFQFSFVDV